MIRLVQRHLEAIYDIEAPDVRDFLLDDEAMARAAPEVRPGREWVLVRQDGDGLFMGVYVDPSDIDALEGRTPAEAVHACLGSFAVVTEGVSHFLLLCRRATADEEVSLLELEAQAEVDKYVTARLHVGPDPGLRRRLFRESRLVTDLGPDESERYREAGRLADRYCARLERCRDVPALLAELRTFYRLSGHARMDRLRHAA